MLHDYQCRAVQCLVLIFAIIYLLIDVTGYNHRFHVAMAMAMAIEEEDGWMEERKRLIDLSISYILWILHLHSIDAIALHFIARLAR